MMKLWMRLRLLVMLQMTCTDVGEGELASVMVGGTGRSVEGRERERVGEREGVREGERGGRERGWERGRERGEGKMKNFSSNIA
jgi:hypothetical protein